MERKMSQCDRVLQFMKKHGSITDNDAHEYLHINRLSGRIFDLRSRGYDIVMVWEKSKSPYNEWTRYGRYKLRRKK